MVHVPVLCEDGTSSGGGGGVRGVNTVLRGTLKAFGTWLGSCRIGGTTHGARGEPGPWAHRVVMARAPAKGETAGTSEQLCSDLQADEEAGLARGEGRATRAVWTRAVKAPRAEPGHRSSGKQERMKGEPHPANAPRTGRAWGGGGRGQPEETPGQVITAQSQEISTLGTVVRQGKPRARTNGPGVGMAARATAYTWLPS